jgi:hypothetical protein
MAGYSRKEFPHWASDAVSHGWTEPEGSSDVRDAALIRDVEGVEIDGGCSITYGTWLDPYTGQSLTDSSEVDIDYVDLSRMPGGLAPDPPGGAPLMGKRMPMTRWCPSPPTTLQNRPKAIRGWSPAATKCMSARRSCGIWSWRSRGRSMI